MHTVKRVVYSTFRCEREDTIAQVFHIVNLSSEAAVVVWVES